MTRFPGSPDKVNVKLERAVERTARKCKEAGWERWPAYRIGDSLDPRLRAFMERLNELGLSLDIVCDLAGVPRARVNGWLYGDNRPRSIADLDKLGAVVGLGRLTWEATCRNG